MVSTRKRHSKEFKLDAVRLSQESGKTIGQVADEPSIPRNTLNRWRGEYKNHSREAFRGNGHRSEKQKRIHELERENERLKRDREILVQLTTTKLLYRRVQMMRFDDDSQSRPSLS